MMNKLFKRFGIIIRLAAYDFKAVYAGSVLGSVWAVAEPLVTVAVYWFVYTVAFGGADIDGIKYYIWLSAGLSAWLFISNGINKVTSVYRDYSYLVRKLSFDKSTLPQIRCVSALLNHMIFLGVVVVICAAEGTAINPAALLAAIVITWIFVYSWGRISALFCAVFKDVQNITAVALNVGFWLTPVFWRADSVEEGIKGLVYINPAAVLVEAYRKSLLYGEFIGAEAIGYLLAICVSLILIGNWISSRLLPDIADRL